MSTKMTTACVATVGEDLDIETEITECRRYGYILNKKFLGSGAYAQVFSGQPTLSKIRTNSKLRASQKGQKGFQIAIKVVDVKTAPETYITKFLPREISAMSKCNGHPNVVKLLDLFATEKKIYLVLEYAEAGDLLKFVNKSYLKKIKGSSGFIEEERAKEIFRDIIAGVAHIHASGVAHRDLKCENVLLSKDGRAKLSDFGFAIRTDEDDDLLKTHCGSYAYAAPEILRKLNYCGRPADMWSLGVILFAVLHGCLPFKGSSSKEVLKSMKKTIFLKPTLTAECKDLIRGLLKMRPSSRLTTETITSHPWLTGYDSTRGYNNNMGVGDSMGENATVPVNNITKRDCDNSVFTRPCKFDNPKYVSAYLQKVLRNEEATLRTQIRKSERRKIPIEVKSKQLTPGNKVERKSSTKIIRGSCITNKTPNLKANNTMTTFNNVREETFPDVQTSSWYDSSYQKRSLTSKVDDVKQAHRSPVDDRSEPDRSPIQLMEEVERKLTQQRLEVDGTEKAIEHIKTCFAQTNPSPPLEYRIKTRNEPTSRSLARERNFRRNRCWGGQAYGQQYKNLPSKIGSSNILPPASESREHEHKSQSMTTEMINSTTAMEVRRPTSSTATATYYKRYCASTSSCNPSNRVSYEVGQQQIDARKSPFRQHYEGRDLSNDLIITALFPSSCAR